jgi:hypothetical protein
MSKFLKVAGISLLTAVVGLAVVAGLSLAQGPSGTPTPGDKGGLGPGLDLGMLGGGGDWTVFDAAAKALGLAPEELFAELHSGKTLTDIATDKGVDIKTVTQAMADARQAAMKKAIEQAVTDGRMTRDQADWTLKGIENGWMGGMGGPGFEGRGPAGPGGQPPAQPQQ